MPFNSLKFAGFFTVVFVLYWLCRRSRRLQNALLLLAGYVFYGAWDLRFLSLLFFSTCLDYAAALKMAGCEGRKRRLWLVLSVAANLGLLGFFKYFNFFAESLQNLAALAGLSLSAPALQIALPVGISFYTFQKLGYSIDVFQKRVEPRRNFLDFALFAGFFPVITAGPIERAGRLLPQIERPRALTAGQLDAGLFLIIWGLFKKLAVADNAALVADRVFDGYAQYGGLDLVIGALAFTLQIYGDFSGYSDIARGLGKLLGFDLMINFKLPYLALDPSDFWRRWHVSLSTWLRDYLYIPLGGNRGGVLGNSGNLLLTMLLCGLWHGAAWTFVLWGLYHAALLIVYRILRRFRWPAFLSTGLLFPLSVGFRRALMFALVAAGWVIFRAESAEQAFYFFSHAGLAPSAGSGDLAYEIAFLAFPLLLFHLFQYYRDDLLIALRWPVWVRAPLYAVLVASIVVFGVREPVEFIYFNF